MQTVDVILMTALCQTPMLAGLLADGGRSRYSAKIPDDLTPPYRRFG